MSRDVSIDQALCSPKLLGAGFDNDLTTWRTWRTVLKAAFGTKLDDDERALFASVAGDRRPPTKRVRELWAVVGRRGGKSRMAAALACYIALFTEHKLARGERGQVLVLAASVSQAATVFEYIRGFLEASPTLAREIASSNASEITLKNGIIIAVHSNSFRTVRGRTLVACILDEVSFWRDETSATPDVEVYRAVLPSLATVDGSMLIGISTPYRRLGLLHQKHRDHFGVDDDDVLVVQGPSKVFNPSLDDAVLAAQRSADPAAAGSEWDAEFRSDIAAFLDDALIDRAVEHGRPLELPPAGKAGYYKAFTDAAGGTGGDAYTLCIGHKEGTKDDERFVIDVVKGTSGQFDPQAVTKYYAKTIREYGLRSVTGDNYAAQWVAGAWSSCGVHYQKCELPKSQVYLEVLPLFTRGLVRLPDHPRLLRELRLLERQTHRGGRDTVDHPRGGHDDHANAVCGVLRELSNYLGYNSRYSEWVGGSHIAHISDPYGDVARMQLGLYQASLMGGRII